MVHSRLLTPAVLALHVGAGSSLHCLSSNPSPCLRTWKAKDGTSLWEFTSMWETQQKLLAENDPRSWAHTTITWEIQVGLIIPGFGLSQP